LKGPLGFDLVNFVPDYSKSAEENQKAFREAYKRVYGVYPPEPSKPKGPTDKG